MYIIGERERHRGREEREMEEKRERHKFYIIWLCNLYYFIGLYVKIKIEILNVLINGLIK